MGANMAERLRAKGIDVVAYDRDPDRSDATDLAGLIDATGPPLGAAVPDGRQLRRSDR